MRYVNLLSIALTLTFAAPAFSEELCFSVPEAKRILADLEAGRQCVNEYRPAADNVITLDEERIDELRAERDKAVDNLKQGDKACEDAVKAAQGTWWERTRKAGGWMGLGAVVAAVAILLL